MNLRNLNLYDYIHVTAVVGVNNDLKNPSAIIRVNTLSQSPL